MPLHLAYDLISHIHCNASTDAAASLHESPFNLKTQDQSNLSDVTRGVRQTAYDLKPAWLSMVKAHGDSSLDKTGERLIQELESTIRGLEAERSRELPDIVNVLGARVSFSTENIKHACSIPKDCN